MSEIKVNGEPRTVEDGTTVEGLLNQLDVPAEGRGIAVAVDTEVIPRSRWADVVLPDGVEVEVVKAVQGG
jgi:sulfur carrier protein